MRPPPPVQIFPRPEIDLAGPSKTFPPQTTRDIIRLMALQKDAEKDKKKRSAEDSPGCEIDAICNANKSAKGNKNPKVAAPKTASRKKAMTFLVEQFIYNTIPCHNNGDVIIL